MEAAPMLTLKMRWLCLVSGLSIALLLAIARMLTPSPFGMGTHQQLGLPPCTVLELWGIPCPACGMTTSWSLVTRGRIFEAAQANSGGMLLALIALAFLPASCYFFVSGKATRDYWFSWTLAVSLLAGLGTALVHWSLRLL
ncbi:MAG: DUF2752 domain-containing protein [Pirellulaceae bacterium]|nr:DUF2752 domain-containing protein [Pirellulaceae bacterium]